MASSITLELSRPRIIKAFIQTTIIILLLMIHTKLSIKDYPKKQNSFEIFKRECVFLSHVLAWQLGNNLLSVCPAPTQRLLLSVPNKILKIKLTRRYLLLTEG